MNETETERNQIYSCGSTSAGYTTALNWWMTFLFSPLLGVLSDSFGRRPLLVASAVINHDPLQLAIFPVKFYLQVALAFDFIAFGLVTRYEKQDLPCDPH